MALSAQILTPHEFEELAELIGPEGATDALQQLTQRQLPNASVKLLRSFLVAPLLSNRAFLTSTLTRFRSAERHIQALALMGLRLDVRHRQSKTTSRPQPYLRLFVQEAELRQASNSGERRRFPSESMNELLQRSQKAWGNCEAKRRAVGLLLSLDFPSRERDHQTREWGTFGYSDDDERKWRKLLTAIHDEAQQSHVVALLAQVLDHPQQLAPTRRRTSDHLPDITALLQDMLNIQRGILSTVGLTMEDHSGSMAPGSIVALDARDLTDFSVPELIEEINMNEVTEAARQFRRPSSVDDATATLEVFLWRRDQLQNDSVALRTLEQEFEWNTALTSFTQSRLNPDEPPTQVPSLKSVQEQFLAYLRACKTPEQRADAARAILHGALDEHWARQLAEAQGIDDVKRALGTEVEVVLEQSQRTTKRIVELSHSTQGIQLHAKEALLARLTQKVRSVLEVADKSLDETREALWEEMTKQTSFRVLAVKDLKGASLLRELKTKNETGIAIRRGQKQERALIKPYKDGDLYDSEASTNDLSSGGGAGSLIKRAYGGERILIREGHHHAPLAVFAPTTPVVDAHLVRTGRLKDNK